MKCHKYAPLEASMRKNIDYLTLFVTLVEILVENCIFLIPCLRSAYKITRNFSLLFTCPLRTTYGRNAHEYSVQIGGNHACSAVLSYVFLCFCFQYFWMNAK